MFINSYCLDKCKLSLKEEISVWEINWGEWECLCECYISRDWEWLECGIKWEWVELEYDEWRGVDDL